jgi:hypothetical protein
MSGKAERCFSKVAAIGQKSCSAMQEARLVILLYLYVYNGIFRPAHIYVRGKRPVPVIAPEECPLVSGKSFGLIVQFVHQALAIGEETGNERTAV